VVDEVGLGDLFADLVERVQRRQRVLEDHRHVATAQLADLFVVHADDVPAADEDIAAHLGALGVVQTEHRERRDALARAGLADDPERAAPLDRE
jgi:hypothetical protein